MNQPTEITQEEYDKQAAWVEQFGKDFTKTVRISRAEYEELKQQRDELQKDAERYRKLKSLALTAQTSKTFAISKFEGHYWAPYELSPIDLDEDLDALIVEVTK